MARILISLAVLALSTQIAIGDDLDQLAGKIRPTRAEELWRTIPWCRSAEEALKTARTENREIFVWAAAGHPFERC